MNKLELERENNRSLYRELFMKGNEAFKKQINDIKSESFCKNLKICCKIRYSDLSPGEIFELKKQCDFISEEYTRLFIPYGASNDFDYKVTNNVDINLNNSLARKIAPDYVNSIITKTKKENYFYYCRFLNGNNECTSSGGKSVLCNNFPNSVTTILPKECGYREWQKQAIDKINNQISKDICNKLNDINNYKETSFHCKKTGTCCRLACSEFTYEELKEKAQKGDKFASQFTSIFIPYESIEEAGKVFPEYIELVKKTLGENEKINFYHCPHVSDENLCTMYESRPDICREFPGNPLCILPFNCGFYDWKEEVNVASMLLLALTEISGFNLKKIQAVLD